MAGSSAWRESLSRWQKLKANKMPSVEFCAGRTWSAGAASVSLTVFMMGSRENKKPCYLFGSRAEENRVKLFSFALPVGRPYQDGVRGFNNESGHGAIRKNGNLGQTRGISVGLYQHHLDEHQHGAWKVHLNRAMSNSVAKRA